MAKVFTMIKADLDTLCKEIKKNPPNREFINLLIDNFDDEAIADINDEQIAFRRNGTIILWLIERGWNRELEKLLQKGANPNIIYYRKTTLEWYMNKLSIDGLRIMLENGADPNIYADELNPLLHQCIGAGIDENMVLMVLDHTTNPHTLNQNGENILMCALKYGVPLYSLEFIKSLVEKYNIDITSSNNDNETILDCASKYNNPLIIDYIEDITSTKL